VLFLQLEGAQITEGTLSDAPTNQSYVCGGTFPAWDHGPFGQDRAVVVERLRLEVLDLFADFNLQVVTERPLQPPYVMVVVGGTASLCQRPDGLGGLGPLDCDNADLSDVAFVFGATIISLEGLAVAIAHEAAHTWGLPHTTEPCDVMSSAWCSGDSKRFRDQEMSVPPDPSGSCGLQSSNSWQRLLAVLGPRTASPDASLLSDAAPPFDTRPSDAVWQPGESSPPPGPRGCSAAPERGSPRGFSLIGFVALSALSLLLLAWSRRAAAQRESSDGHSRRDQLGHG
jgi:hypothetical protein